ncbi:DUF3592 domain-containing protein [Actinomadura darangshiensis]|uniref:DUF3592 domain-containing protein n=1 Tax=Actinomadura darangshiensis TaxID=705336 RepID=A0A4R5A6M6_9ACTN|nr:DUF3592 domain-containing protein [Actinomadura darangshiensis]TDD67601.1 DUF3592 domain-containing protein [Actinomadura darangshiensis]
MNDAVHSLLFPLFTLFGGVFVVVGVRTVLGHRRFLRNAVRVPGTVTALRSERSSNQSSYSSTSRSVVYRPILRFTTLDGRIVETASPFAANPAPARVGASLEVLYDPADPTSARHAGTGGSGTFHGLIFAAAGTLFAVIGLIGDVNMLR